MQQASQNRRRDDNHRPIERWLSEFVVRVVTPVGVVACVILIARELMQ